MQLNMSSKQIILDNIRSAHNVGSIFRSSDGAGVEKIYLVGPTPTPIDRFGRVQPEIVKTSLGASESIQWEHVGDSENVSIKETIALIEKLKQEGFTIVAVEQSTNS
ncbi:MAG: 23S rRNA (guanosine2251-2'-O)-methyltransferase, partial [Acidimicrobiales bacterium]